jgi:hypothetical protein
MPKVDPPDEVESEPVVSDRERERNLINVADELLSGVWGICHDLLEQYVTIGRVLLNARELVVKRIGERQWPKWLEKNVKWPPTHVEAYMRLARRWDEMTDEQHDDFELVNPTSYHIVTTAPDEED